MLTARSEALDLNDLASFHVGSPDPLKCGYCGQQIIVEWDLPPKIASRQDLKLIISMVTTKHLFQKVAIPIKKARSYYVYRQINNALFENGAILTYKIEIFSGASLLKCWKQQGWVDWLDFDSM